MNKLHASLAVISAAAVLGTTGALALPAVAATAQSGTHTLKFISVTGKSIMLTKGVRRSAGRRCQRGRQDRRVRHALDS